MLCARCRPVRSAAEADRGALSGDLGGLFVADFEKMAGGCVALRKRRRRQNNDRILSGINPVGQAKATSGRLRRHDSKLALRKLIDQITESHGLVGRMKFEVDQS